MTFTKEKKIKYFFGIPFFAWHIVVFIMPLIFLFIHSFFTYRNYRIIEQLSFANYKEIFSSQIFYTSLLNSVRISVISTVIVISLSLAVSYFIYARVNPKHQKVFVFVILLPLLTNYLLRSYSWSIILSEKGILNWLMLKTHLISEPLPLLFSEFAIIVGLVSFLTPIVVLLFYLGMTMVNKETIQASLNLGMNELKTFFKVVLPQIKVFVFMGAFFAFVMSFGDYVVPAILGGGTTYTYSYNIVDVLNINNSPKASALGVIILLLFLLIAFIFLKFIKEKRK